MKNNKTILITGITGQDGIFLTNELLKNIKKLIFMALLEKVIILITLKN